MNFKKASLSAEVLLKITSQINFCNSIIHYQKVKASLRHKKLQGHFMVPILFVYIFNNILTFSNYFAKREKTFSTRMEKILSDTICFDKG